MEEKIDIPGKAIKQSCRYSFNELDSLKRIILNRLSEIQYNGKYNIFGCGVFNKINRVGIVFYDFDENKINDFRNNILNDSRIKFLSIESLDTLYELSNNSISSKLLQQSIDETIQYGISEDVHFFKSGIPIMKVGDLGGASLGYRVVDKDGNAGFISAGHFLKKGDIVLTVTGDTIGECKASHSGNYLDAAFCKNTDPNFRISNAIYKYSNDTLSSIVKQPIEKATIYNTGLNGLLEGKVINSSFDLVESKSQGKEIIFPDVILMSINSKNGNSGGPIFVKGLRDRLNYTVGIMMGNYEWNSNPQQMHIPCSVCIKAYMINHYFKVDRY